MTGLRRLAPELVAALAGVVVWALIGGVATLGGSGTTPRPSAEPSGPVVASARPSATIDGSLVVLLRSSNTRLAEERDQLVALLAADLLDTAEVTSSVRQVNAAARFADDIADRLEVTDEGIRIAAALHAAYDAVLAAADDVLSQGLSNEAGIRASATVLVERLDAIPDIDALLADPPSAPPSVVPSASAEPTPPPPSATPQATPSPSPSPTPSPSVPPSPSSAPAINLAVNPGFESGPDPWRYEVGPGASGTFRIVSDDVHSGTGAARIVVTGGTGPWSAGSLRQDGLVFANGSTVTVSMWVHSTAVRDIRIRVTTGLGEVIASRIETVDATWRWVTFDFTAIGRVDDASLVIEIGRSGEPVWIDDVGVG